MKTQLQLKNLKTKIKIEQMEHCHQIEVLRICKKNNIIINENNNGTFINLTEQDSNIIEQLEKFVNYVLEQQEHFNEIETEKDRIQNIFFKDNKENSNIKIS
jgi:septum formation inhibitor-activating ATPase MinD